MKRFFLGAVAGALATFGLGRVFPQAPPRFAYSTSKPAELSSVGAVAVHAPLPAGVPVVSWEKLTSNSDVGWWGRIPVLLGTDTEASPLLKASPPWDPLESYPVVNLQSPDR